MSTAAPARQSVLSTFVRSWWPWLSVPARLLVGIIRDGVSATPTVRLDGSDVPSETWADPTAFATMIDAAADGTN